MTNGWAAETELLRKDLKRTEELAKGLTDEIVKLREALEFYADKNTYKQSGLSLLANSANPIQLDQGEKARKALGRE
jgi:hypothetical protein